MLNNFLSTLFMLFLLINPIGLVPVFLSLTSGTPDSYKQKMAIKGAVVSGILLLLFGYVGDFILTSLGISLAAFRVGGGLLLGITGIRMVLEFRQRDQKEKAEAHNPDDLQDIAIFPIATLFIAGPGAITAMMLTMNAQSGDWLAQISTIFALIIILTTVTISFILSGKIAKYLPEEITSVITRVLGMLIIALAMQLIFDGIKSAFGLG